MEFNEIHHIAIICSDYKKSKHFYVDLLGFEVVNEFYRTERDSYKLDLKVGDKYQIELFSFPNPAKRPSYPEATGLRHIAFEVNNIDAAIKELSDKGIETEEVRIDRIMHPDGKRFTFFADPDGLPIEIYEK